MGRTEPINDWPGFPVRLLDLLCDRRDRGVLWFELVVALVCRQVMAGAQSAPFIQFLVESQPSHWARKSNSVCSLHTSTPSFSAFANLEPAFSPATKKSVFAETLPATLAPKA